MKAMLRFSEHRFHHFFTILQESFVTECRSPRLLVGLKTRRLAKR